MTSHLTDPDLMLLAKLMTAHAKDPCKAYPHLVCVVEHILGGALQREREAFKEDAAIAYQVLLDRHRSEWMDAVRRNLVSNN